MASVISRGNSYSVVYYIKDKKTGKLKQQWESFSTEKLANRRKVEVERDQQGNAFIEPDKQTIAEFLETYVNLYGIKKWGVSTLRDSLTAINKYIIPGIGKQRLQTTTTYVIDQFYTSLQSPENIYGVRVSNHGVHRINKLLKCAFNQALKWDLIVKNPCNSVILPEYRKKEKTILNAEQLQTGLDHCDDPMLYLAMNLAFGCTLRIGEVCGLDWSNVMISPEDFENNNTRIKIDKQLIVADYKCMERLGFKDIIKIYPPIKKSAKQRLVLKAPKTDSSKRIIWLPKTIAYMLLEWKQTQDRYRKDFDKEYQEPQLIFTFANGRPIAPATIRNRMEALVERNGLPSVDFHSLRHSSATYKLKVTHGNIKATQGDSGHSKADMITNLYAHIIDEERKVNAQLVEENFYNKTSQAEQAKDDAEKLMSMLEQSPELLEKLSKLMELRNER